MKQMRLFDAKNRLSAVVHRVESGTPIELTRHGKPAVVIVSSESFHRLSGDGPRFSSRYEWFRNRFSEDGIADADCGDPSGDLRSYLYDVVSPSIPVVEYGATAASIHASMRADAESRGTRQTSAPSPTST